MTTQTRNRAVSVLTLGHAAPLPAERDHILAGRRRGYRATRGPTSGAWCGQGVPAYTSTPQQGHTVLIVNGGENWREIRNGFIMRFSQWVSGRGAGGHRTAVSHRRPGQTGKTPFRGEGRAVWTFGERFLHWYTAVIFIIMALTGLSLLLGRMALIPIFGHPVVAGWLGRRRCCTIIAGRSSSSGSSWNSSSGSGTTSPRSSIWSGSNVWAASSAAGRDPMRRRSTRARRHGSGSCSSSASAWGSPASCSIFPSGARPASPCRSPM